MTLSIDQSPAVAIKALLEMTPTEINILGAIHTFIRYVDYGKHKECFPSVPTLARAAGVSKRTVERFLTSDITIWFEKRSGKKMFKPNRYEMLDGMYDALEFFRAKGYLKNIKKHKKWIQEKFETDGDFFEQKQRHFGHLSTMKWRTENPSKWRTIKNPSSKDLHKEKFKRERTEERAQSCEQKREKEPLRFGKAYMFLKEVGVSEGEAQKIDRSTQLPDEAWFQSRNDYRWFEKRQTIYNPAGFMVSRAKEHTKRMMGL